MTSSTFPPGLVALHLPFPLFLIVPVLSYLLRVPTVVDDGVLRLCEAENSLLAMLGEVSSKSPAASPKKAM